MANVSKLFLQDGTRKVDVEGGRDVVVGRECFLFTVGYYVL